MNLEVRQRRQQHLVLPRELADPAERRPAVDLAQLDLEQRRPAEREGEVSAVLRDNRPGSSLIRQGTSLI